MDSPRETVMARKLLSELLLLLLPLPLLMLLLLPGAKSLEVS